MTRSALLERVYEAFNSRDIDTVLGALHPDVDWPNGWEGGRIAGRDGVRDYWTRQWAVLDPKVTPISIVAHGDGRLTVRVRQLVKDQSTDMTRLRQLSGDLQQLAAGLSAAGYAQETAGSGGRAGQNGPQRGGTADEVIDAEFKPRS